jgi:hypothetical protein
MLITAAGGIPPLLGGQSSAIHGDNYDDFVSHLLAKRNKTVGALVQVSRSDAMTGASLDKMKEVGERRTGKGVGGGKGLENGGNDLLK